MIKCLKCFKNIPSDSNLCPYCGEKVITNIADRQKIKQQSYNNKTSNLKHFLTKNPLDINRARIIDWTNKEEYNPKKPIELYVLIPIIIITLSLLIIYVLI